MDLSFSEKRALQKTVADGMAALKGGKVAFTEKRALQKQIQEALTKLNAKVEDTTPADTYLPDGWTEAAPSGMATSRDPVTGGIVDSEILSGEWFVIPENPALQKMIGFKTRKDAFDALAAALATLTAPNPQGQNLLDLQAGKFDSLDPLAFLGKLKEISDELNDIEPLKGSAIAYIEKNSERVSAVMESAMQEAFGKLWDKGAAS